MLRRRTAGWSQDYQSEASSRRDDTRHILHGESRLFDTTQLEEAAFAHLGQEEIFLHPTLSHGVLTWDEGNIDIAPEYVYEHSYAYDGVAI